MLGVRVMCVKKARERERERGCECGEGVSVCGWCVGCKTHTLER